MTQTDEPANGGQPAFKLVGAAAFKVRLVCRGVTLLPPPLATARRASRTSLSPDLLPCHPLSSPSCLQRHNPRTDRFPMHKFDHIELWCGDATTTSARCVAFRWRGPGLRAASWVCRAVRLQPRGCLAGCRRPPPAPFRPPLQVWLWPGADPGGQERPVHGKPPLCLLRDAVGCARVLARRGCACRMAGPRAPPPSLLARGSTSCQPPRPATALQATWSWPSPRPTPPKPTSPTASRPWSERQPAARGRCCTLAPGCVPLAALRLRLLGCCLQSRLVTHPRNPATHPP